MIKLDYYSQSVIKNRHRLKYSNHGCATFKGNWGLLNLHEVVVFSSIFINFKLVKRRLKLGLFFRATSVVAEFAVQNIILRCYGRRFFSKYADCAGKSSLHMKAGFRVTHLYGLGFKPAISGAVKQASLSLSSDS